MEFETSLGAEVQEVAEPAVEEMDVDLDSSEGDVDEGVEAQEVTEPASGKTSADEAFAEMRRRAALAESQLAEARKRNAELDEALGLYFSGDDKVASAIAHYQERSVEEVRQELDERAELSALREENARYRQQAIEARAEVQMAADLKAVRALDPDVKSIDDLGQAFVDMRFGGGLSAEDAYFAVMAKRQATERKPAVPAGRIQGAGEAQVKDFYSYDEVKAHENDPAWIDKHYDTIQKSMKRW